MWDHVWDIQSKARVISQRAAAHCCPSSRLRTISWTILNMTLIVKSILVVVLEKKKRILKNVLACRKLEQFILVYNCHGAKDRLHNVLKKLIAKKALIFWSIPTLKELNHQLFLLIASLEICFWVTQFSSVYTNNFYFTIIKY